MKIRVLTAVCAIALTALATTSGLASPPAASTETPPGIIEKMHADAVVTTQYCAFTFIDPGRAIGTFAVNALIDVNELTFIDPGRMGVLNFEEINGKVINPGNVIRTDTPGKDTGGDQTAMIKIDTSPQGIGDVSIGTSYGTIASAG